MRLPKKHLNSNSICIQIFNGLTQFRGAVEVRNIKKKNWVGKKSRRQKAHQFNSDANFQPSWFATTLKMRKNIIKSGGARFKHVENLTEIYPYLYSALKTTTYVEISSYYPRSAYTYRWGRGVCIGLDVGGCLRACLSGILETPKIIESLCMIVI